MKTYFLPCAVCGSIESERIAPIENMQAIVICRHCGLVYRNPQVPGLRPAAGTVDDIALQTRARAWAEDISKRVTLEAGEYFLDVASGGGFVAQELSRRFPAAGAVLLEPDMAQIEHAKRRNLAAAVLPSSLEEADLPSGAFSLVIAAGVDHRFAHHRRDMQTLVDLLAPAGTLYIERTVFIDRYAEQPEANTWFGREQFREYVAQFVEIYEALADGGIFGRKPAATASAPPVTNRYAEHLARIGAAAR